MIVRSFALAAVAAVVLATSANADQIVVGDIVITEPWARATPQGAPVAGGFMRIDNKGTAPDRLIGGSLPAAGRFEVHEMKMEGDVMKMRPLTDGLAIPPGGSVELKPGSYHIMFMDLKQQLVEGTTLTGTLRFEKAGTVDVRYAVRAVGASGSKAPAGHQGGTPDHKGH
ncbi:copper chaperone PCu(A)C [Blastochloris viridis]|uniref:Copper metallochaperone n=1 Tax=Blastochloris viridis TaxID=1079 RepID=A0A0H5BHN8_BLAVI|nr:copper chaperone PCu(A)C [Blastochloris viridis]ALK10167.1 hypothetical protein BVIR_2400 [Blastochloris viridis]BAR99901.1 copper metallochaperone [Blastochloris viridis]CUU42831.1 hypothetical protein BVIRIDIS_18460 [Blastochloris viridis]